MNQNSKIDKEKDDTINSLTDEIAVLKKKIGIIAVIGIFFGGGGIFGAFKWIDSERKLTATIIRQNSIQTEITKNDALNKHFSKQIEELKSIISKKSTNLEDLKKAKQQLMKIEKQRQKTNEDFGNKMPAMF